MGKKKSKLSPSVSSSATSSSSTGPISSKEAVTVTASPEALPDGTHLIDPSLIYFTFSRIRPVFSCGRTIESTRQQFLKGELRVTDLPLLSVFTDGKGHFFSQNNRRLYLYKTLREGGLLETIPVRIRPLPSTKRMSEKYTPEKCALQAKLMGIGSGAGEKRDEVCSCSSSLRKGEKDDSNEDPEEE